MSFGEIAADKIAGFVLNLGGVGASPFHIASIENYPYDSEIEAYAVVDPESKEVVGVLSPFGAATTMKPFRAYFLQPYKRNVSKREEEKNPVSI